MVVLVLKCVFVTSLLITAALRRYALTHRILDLPNARSSHAVPTPRGGGLSIVVCVLAAAPLLFFVHDAPQAPQLAMLGAAAVATVGWLDDRRDVPARWRF